MSEGKEDRPQQGRANTGRTQQLSPRDAGTAHTNLQEITFKNGKCPEISKVGLCRKFLSKIILGFTVSTIMSSIQSQLASLAAGIPFDPIPGPEESVLKYEQDPSVPHAPVRVHGLTREQKIVRIRTQLYCCEVILSVPIDLEPNGLLVVESSSSCLSYPVLF